MEYTQQLFGSGTSLTVLQMLLRGIVVFIIALLIFRIAGKRTFGQMSATDNVIMIVLGAVLSRAVVGASPFLPIILTSLCMVLLHRVLAWASVKSDFIGYLIKGEKTSLYKNGKFNAKNMERTMMSEKDITEGVRMQINSASLEEVDEIFLERNGVITVVKK